MEIVKWKMENGKWNMEYGIWKIKNGKRKKENRKRKFFILIYVFYYANKRPNAASKLPDSGLSWSTISHI